MRDFLINSILIIVVITIYFYFLTLYRKSSYKINQKKISSIFSKIMIAIFTLFWVFLMITSLTRYYENIFLNLIISTALIGLLIFIFYRNTKKTNFYPWIELIKVSVLIIFLLFNFSTITNKIQFISRGDAISIDELEKGDILFLHTGLADSFLPGYWSHIGLIVDNDGGLVSVIESTTNGVHLLSLGDFIGEGRVSVAKPKNLTLQSKETIVSFAKDKINLPYDFYLIDKQIGGERYYCSELIWASYQQVGVDIDKNPGFFIKYLNAVAPQEIFGDDDLIIYHVNRTLESQIVISN
jgi:hypothetical protein